MKTAYGLVKSQVKTKSIFTKPASNSYLTSKAKSKNLLMLLKN